MKEKDFQTKFNRWCQYHIKTSSAFELKLSKTKAIPFSSVVEHQLNALLIAKHHSLAYKIPDCGFQNPFDSFVLVGVPAYIVVMFYARGQREFFLIDIDTWIKEVKTSDRKSLTEDRAREIGKSYFLLSSPAHP